MTATMTTLEQQVKDQCDLFIENDMPFSAVAVSEALKAKGAKNDDGDPIRHRDVNELVRAHMFDLITGFQTTYQQTTTNPTENINGDPINSPDGIFVYHPVGYDADDYKHPAISRPGSSSVVIQVSGEDDDSTKADHVAQELAEKDEIESDNSDLVRVSYTFTDETDDGSDVHLLRVSPDYWTADSKDKKIKNSDIFKAVCEKIKSKVSKAYDNQEGTSLDLSEVNEPIIIGVSCEDGTKKTFKTFQEFDDAYGVQPEDEDDSSSNASLPEDHLAVEKDGRVRIRAHLAAQIPGQKMILTEGDVPGTVKYEFSSDS